MLFLIRGIASDYQFLLRTEIPGLGGKFDDLIFKYSLVPTANTSILIVPHSFVNSTII
jgi:hypothetical protein